ncbi:MAG: prepilin-type N-terminal cleavage/methylation domain-containing protein [Terrimicrobiaceae bacterium]
MKADDFRFQVSGFRLTASAFSLIEMLVSVAVLALLMVLIGQIFTAATAVTGLRSKRMDADAQARAIFGRMAIDFGQIVRRADVDYFLKSSAADPSGNDNPQPGNDQMAFYSQVPGYSTANAATQSPVSVVAWRINADTSGPHFNQLQRLGTGLQRSGASAMAFSGADGPLNSATANNKISGNWPVATSPDSPDSSYESAGPQVFRMEYHYLLRGQTVAGTAYSAQPSETPWDARIPGHAAVDGLRDVAAMTVVIAVADPKSRQLVTDTQLKDLADKMQDFSAATMPEPGDLEAQWQTAIEDPANGIPKAAASALRVYRRSFPLPSTP